MAATSRGWQTAGADRYWIRRWVAWVFFASGLTKIKSRSSAIYLFGYGYKVPLLPPETAAYLGTAAELILPESSNSGTECSFFQSNG